MVVPAEVLSCIGLEPTRERAGQFAAGIGIGIGLSIVVAAAGHLFLGWHWQESDPRRVSAMASSLGLVFVTATVEELVFRGFGFRWTLDRYGEGWAQFSAAALYCAWFLWQGWPPMSILTGPLIASWILGKLFIGSEGVVMPIGTHMGWGWCQDNLPAIVGQVAG